MVIATLRTKYLDPEKEKAMIHSLGGTIFEDLTTDLQQYTPKKLHTVTVIAGFNDHEACSNDFLSYRRKLWNTIDDKFQPLFIFVPKTVGSAINRFISNQINNLHAL